MFGGKTEVNDILAGPPSGGADQDMICLGYLLTLRIWLLISRSRSGRAAFTKPLPLTAIAFRFLDPITAPKPQEPLASLSAKMLANGTRCSPAGPMATTFTDLPNSALSASLVCAAPFPQREAASLICTVSSWIERYVHLIYP